MNFKYSDEIKDGFLKDKYCKGLFEALKKVKAEFRLDAKCGQVGELVFAYELYHQWRKQLDSYNPENLILLGEPKKTLQNQMVVQNTKKKPDLVLHKMEDNKSNRIACEIKICKRGISKDFKKLKGMISHIEDLCVTDNLYAHDYKWGVFIFTGNKFNILSSIKNLVNDTDEYDKIVCIHTPSNNELEIKTIGELKNNNEQ